MKPVITIAVLLVTACSMPLEDPWSGLSDIDLEIPTKQGEALPTPPKPLRDVKGIGGSIPEPEDVDLLVRYFDDAVFGLQWGGRHPYIKKWARPVIGVEFRPSIAPEVASAGWRALAIVGDLTGIEFVPALDVHLRDVVLSYTGEIDVGNPVGCWFYFRPSPETGTIWFARVTYLPMDLDIDMEGCMMEETAQITGVMNDTYLLDDVLFARSNQKRTTLAWADAVIIRALYDNRLKPGMHLDEALPIARTVIEELVDGLN